jgi:hypothetical protein
MCQPDFSNLHVSMASGCDARVGSISFGEVAFQICVYLQGDVNKDGSLKWF